MLYAPISFAENPGKFDQHWCPRGIAEMSDCQFKRARLKAEFNWHAHADTVERFIVLDGKPRIELRDGQVALAAGEMTVVPKGIEHRPVAESEAKLLLRQPRGVANTGDAGGELTADGDVRI